MVVQERVGALEGDGGQLAGVPRVAAEDELHVVPSDPGAVANAVVAVIGDIGAAEERPDARKDEVIRAGLHFRHPLQREL